MRGKAHGVSLAVFVCWCWRFLPWRITRFRRSSCGQARDADGSGSKLEWINPNVYVYLDAKDSTGKTANWALKLRCILSRCRISQDDQQLEGPNSLFCRCIFSRQDKHTHAGLSTRSLEPLRQRSRLVHIRTPPETRDCATAGNRQHQQTENRQRNAVRFTRIETSRRRWRACFQTLFHHNHGKENTPSS